MCGFAQRSVIDKTLSSIRLPAIYKGNGGDLRMWRKSKTGVLWHNEPLCPNWPKENYIEKVFKPKDIKEICPLCIGLTKKNEKGGKR